MPYPADFREQAVRLVVQSGRSVREVSAELSISSETLRRWMRQETQPGTTISAATPDRPSDGAGLNGWAAPAATAKPLPPRSAVLEAPSRVVTASRRQRATRRVPVSYVATAYLAVTACWGLSISLAALLQPPGTLQRAGAAVHVLSLVVSFGAVLLVDWHGLLWLVGRRSMHDCVRVAAAARPLIWAGLAGLLLSGMLLRPDLSDPLIWIKLVAVLMILVNGVAVGGLAADLEAADGADASVVRPSTGLVRRVLTSGALSAAAWWTAIVIGLITDAHRH